MKKRLNIRTIPVYVRLLYGALICAPLRVLLASEFVVTQGSEIHYIVVHPFHRVIGVNREITGGFAFDPNHPSKQSGIKDRVIRVRWDRFDSGNRNRDLEVLNAVRAAHFPEVLFRITGLEQFRLEGQSGNAVVSGFLYIAGHRQAITVPVTFKGYNPTRVSGSFLVKMSDFGIDPPTLLFIPARNEVTIEFELLLVPQTEP